MPGGRSRDDHGGAREWHERVFPGEPSAARDVRTFLTDCLVRAGFPLVDDVVLAGNELAVNALRHSSSGTAGGKFWVRVEITGEMARVEVRDQGPAPANAARCALPPRDDEFEGGRGLTVVSDVATEYGALDENAGHIAWFRLVPPDTTNHSLSKSRSNASYHKGETATGAAT